MGERKGGGEVYKNAKVLGSDDQQNINTLLEIGKRGPSAGSGVFNLDILISRC